MKRLFLLMFLLCAALALEVFNPGSAWAADTTYFQQGGTNGTTDDGWLCEESGFGRGTTNYKSLSGMTSNRRWFIVRFDSCHVALSGKTVTAAWINLRYNPTSASDTVTGNMYRVIEAWEEQAEAYHSSPGWGYRIGTTTTWTTGGCPNDGTSASVTLESHVHFDATGFYRLDLLAATVQKWIDTPTDNQGVIINSPSAAPNGNLYSSEHATTAYRPELVIVTASGATAKNITIKGNVVVKGTVR